MVISWVFGLISSIRNLLFDVGCLKVYRSSLPVICVGNCTVGGTGKTPLVKELVRYLRGRGLRPVVLSRGYGGTRHGPHQVIVSDSALEVGDEPVLLARDQQLPVVVSRSRVNGARFIEQQSLGNVIILDDGYQHRWLARSVNILCLNVATEEAQRDICNQRFLPWGIFRESLTGALKRAHLVVFSARHKQSDFFGISKALREKIPAEIPVLFSSIHSLAIVSAKDRRTLEPQAVNALCAIANPEGFFLSLSQSGFQIAQTAALTDHSQLVGEKCREFLSASELPIVITEKDEVKLPDELRKSGRVFVTEIDLTLEPKAMLDTVFEKALTKI